MTCSIQITEILLDSVSTVLSTFAILITIIFWYRDKTAASYDVFDGMYMDLLSKAMENPAFRDLEQTRNYETAFEGDLKGKYEIYAFMCFNFCETILDKKGKKLMKTWEVIIIAESQLHRKWFFKPENQKFFKKSFVNHIKQ